MYSSHEQYLIKKIKVFTWVLLSYASVVDYALIALLMKKKSSLFNAL